MNERFLRLLSGKLLNFEVAMVVQKSLDQHILRTPVQRNNLK